jgi:hypothetical protein
LHVEHKGLKKLALVYAFLSKMAEIADLNGKKKPSALILSKNKDKALTS